MELLTYLGRAQPPDFGVMGRRPRSRRRSASSPTQTEGVG